MAQKKGFKSNPAMQFISTAEEQEEQRPLESYEAPKGYRLVKESKTIRLQLLIRPTTKDALKQEADRRGLSLNELVNQILDAHIERLDNE